MRFLGSVRKLLPLFIILFVLFVFLLAGGLFLVYGNRPPVLIVTDSLFTQIYGQERLEKQGRKISSGLFRQLITVPVSDTAGSELVAIAVEGASPSPWAVLFPYRYLEGARLYKQSRPEVPVLVFGGSKSMAPPLSLTEDPGINFIYTDTLTDLYRAGLAAAHLAGEKDILVFQDNLFPEEQQELLLERLNTSGFSQEPIFHNASTYYASFDNIGCVIIAGPAAGFLERELEIPALLFSWADPALTPYSVKVIFDDSPWTLALKALKALPLGPQTLIPSELNIIRDRIAEKSVFRQLRAIFNKL